MVWTSRLKFLVGHRLKHDGTSFDVEIGGRSVQVCAPGNIALSDSDWIILTAHDFRSQFEADTFGEGLLRAVAVAGVRKGIGIDFGENRSTMRVGDVVRDAMAKHGAKIMDNVHGLMSYEREGNEVFLGFSAAATVLSPADAFLAQVASSFEEASSLGDKEKSALSMVAMSRLGIDALARAVLAIGAVELIASVGHWSDRQVEILSDLRKSALTHGAEGEEIAEAVGRLYRVSVRQSIKRKMFALGFTNEQWKEFDDLYALRSRIFHGTSGGRRHHVDLASRANALCPEIVMRAVNATGNDTLV